MDFYSNLGSLTTYKNVKRGRISSYDRSGGNADWYELAAGEETVLADIKGPGMINHIWFTVNSKDPLYLRKLVLKMYWDNSNTPSVLCPIGDFFGLGHARTFSYQCACFSTTCTTSQIGGGVAMNSWLLMPFLKNAKITIENQQDDAVGKFYFYIDYQIHQELHPDTVLFHAYWRRENPCTGWTGAGSVWGSNAWRKRIGSKEGLNLSDEDNYLILETEGTGHFIGVNFSIDHVQDGWWGEGDDMFFIDRDGERKWPPDLHGTGSEDYFSHAWGMQKEAHLYCGQPWTEHENGNSTGKTCVYRYHIVDPIPFQRNIRASIEHGHANNRSDDFSSTAYWYQTEVSQTVPQLPPVEDRLPN